jgi:hypothetical protein
MDNNLLRQDGHKVKVQNLGQFAVDVVNVSCGKTRLMLVVRLETKLYQQSKSEFSTVFVRQGAKSGQT